MDRREQQLRTQAGQAQLEPPYRGVQWRCAVLGTSTLHDERSIGRGSVWQLEGQGPDLAGVPEAKQTDQQRGEGKTGSIVNLPLWSSHGDDCHLDACSSH